MFPRIVVNENPAMPDRRSAISQRTALLVLPQFDDLEVFRAHAIQYHYARHFHSGYSIGVIESGVGGNYYRGSTYLAPPQSIVLMNPEEAHTGFSAEGLPLTYRMLYPSVKSVEAIAQELQISGTPYFKDAVIQHSELAQKIRFLHTLLEQPEDLLTQQTLFFEVIATLLNHHSQHISCIKNQQEHRTVQQIKDYLYENYRESVSLDNLSKLTNLNRSYLIRIFRHAVGMPPYTYLNQIRVENAKQLIGEGMSLAETAIAVGMADQSHLNRHFKRIVGISPGQYRQMSISFKTTRI
jgi:AraC-like DNA-binding protein